MTTHQHPLSQTGDRLYLTDGGLETTLIFHDGMDLPCFTAFNLLKDETGTERLRRYYQQYIDVALEYGHGFVLESVTWRASSDWGVKLGYTSEALTRANASCMSHAELDNSETLDDGNPEELGRQYRELRSLLPDLRVVGGCCGTDYRHVEAIARHNRT